jgi:flagellar biogenesis protein FliO
MVGFIVLAIYVYKKSMYSVSDNKNKDFLKVENSLRLSATKTLYVIQAGKEKFLIAGDSANTTMLSKLENSQYNDEFSNYENISEFSQRQKTVQKVNRG